MASPPPGFTERVTSLPPGFSERISSDVAPAPKEEFSPAELAAASVLKTARGIPFADETISGIGALAQALMGAEQPIGDLYSANLSKIDRGIKAYEKDSPTLSKVSAAAEIPISVASLGGALKAASAVPYLGAAVAPIEGSGMTQSVKRLAQGLGIGGVTGALTGADTAQPGQRLAGAEHGAKVGAALGGGFQALAEALAPLGRELTDAGGKLSRSSLGARQTDYTKSANRLGILKDASEGEVETFTKKTLDDLIESGELGRSRDPSKLLARASQNENEIEKQIGEAVQQFDKMVGSPVAPTFEHSKELLASGGVPGDKISAFARRIAKIEDAIESGGNTLSYVQKQKVAVGKDWDPADDVKNEFTRALYRDLQETIEKAIPEVSPLNKQLQKYKVVGPILRRGLAGSESEDVIRKLTGAMRTSGGFGVPYLGLAYTGHPLAGVAVGGLAAASQTQQGKRVLGEALKAAGPTIGSYGGKYSPLVEAILGTSSSSVGK